MAKTDFSERRGFLKLRGCQSSSQNIKLKNPDVEKTNSCVSQVNKKHNQSEGQTYDCLITVAIKTMLHSSFNFAADFSQLIIINTWR